MRAPRCYYAPELSRRLRIRLRLRDGHPAPMAAMNTTMMAVMSDALHLLLGGALGALTGIILVAVHALVEGRKVSRRRQHSIESVNTGDVFDDISIRRMMAGKPEDEEGL